MVLIRFKIAIIVTLRYKDIRNMVRNVYIQQKLYRLDINHEPLILVTSTKMNARYS